MLLLFLVIESRVFIEFNCFTDADFEKWRKRRRRMKERSVSPVSVESGPPTPLKTPYRSEELCAESDYKQKCQFLSQNFHLDPVPHETKKGRCF